MFIPQKGTRGCTQQVKDFRKTSHRLTVHLQPALEYSVVCRCMCVQRAEGCSISQYTGTDLRAELKSMNEHSWGITSKCTVLRRCNMLTPSRWGVIVLVYIESTTTLLRAITRHIENKEVTGDSPTWLHKRQIVLDKLGGFLWQGYSVGDRHHLPRWLLRSLPVQAVLCLHLQSQAQCRWHCRLPQSCTDSEGSFSLLVLALFWDYSTIVTTHHDSTSGQHLVCPQLRVSPVGS